MTGFLNKVTQSVRDGGPSLGGALGGLLSGMKGGIGDKKGGARNVPQFPAGGGPTPGAPNQQLDPAARTALLQAMMARSRQLGGGGGTPPQMGA